VKTKQEGKIMLKKFTAICLAFILVLSMAVIPVFATGSQTDATIENQANIVRNDKKDKDDKDNKKDLFEEIVKKFKDSDQFGWAQKSIEKMGFMGILNGTGNGYFNPKSNVTHAEAIAMVLKLTGYQDEAEAITVEPNYFKGNSDKWSYGYLQLALDKGIIIPSEDGKFNPKTPAKRHEIAKYVVRALGERAEALKNMKAKLSYSDAASIPAGSRGYVYVITDLEIMQGSNNLFQANKPITRAELAVILDKAEGNNAEPGNNANRLQGIFEKFDKEDLEITLKVNGKSVVYAVNKAALVFKNSKYYKLDSLNAGDEIRLVLDNKKTVIFIEFIKSTTTTTPAENELSIDKMSYSSLPKAIQEKVDALKDEQNFAAFEYDEDIYLIATRGEKSTGGYTIDIEEVYKQRVDTNRYNLKAVVKITNPNSSIVTQSITHPYSVVKLDFFDGIEKIKFLDASGDLIKETTIKTVNEEVINGSIYSLDLSDDEVTLTLSTNVRRTYVIPNAADITLNGDNAELSDLKVGMTAKITKTNGVITELEVTSSEEVINGSIYSLDLSDDEVTLTLSTNVRRTYVIPNAAEITLNGDDAELSDLKVGMTAKITKTNGVITELKVTSSEEVINGNIYSLDLSDDEVTLTLSTNVRRTYEIPNAAEITLDGDDAELSDLKVGMTAKITKTNGVITELKVTSSEEVINGNIYSLDLSDDEVTLTLSTNVRRTYEIPNAAEITLDGDDAELSDLKVGMTAKITKINGVITKLTVTTLSEVINGSIYSLDLSDDEVTLTLSTNVRRTYVIPNAAEITLDGDDAELSDLKVGMTAKITKTNGVITELEVITLVEYINGRIYSLDLSDDEVTLSLSTNVRRTYVIPDTAVVTLDGNDAELSDLEVGMTAKITKTNGVITKLAVLD
jgi:hypothetical protein